MSDSSRYILADDVAEGLPVGGDERPNATAREDVIRDGGPAVEEVLCVVFDLGVSERQVYAALARQEESSARDLADDLDRSYRTVNRHLNDLCDKGFVTRRRRILQTGGHIYQYAARSPDEVRALLHAGVQEWIAAAHDCIDDFAGETSTVAAEQTD
ncbi:MAG: putative transcriptional regulator [Haloarculaceae archaeon]|jgi:predicted transcriptional regulator